MTLVGSESIATTGADQAYSAIAYTCRSRRNTRSELDPRSVATVAALVWARINCPRIGRTWMHHELPLGLIKARPRSIWHGHVARRITAPLGLELRLRSRLRAAFGALIVMAAPEHNQHRHNPPSDHCMEATIDPSTDFR